MPKLTMPKLTMPKLTIPEPAMPEPIVLELTMRTMRNHSTFLYILRQNMIE